MPFRHRPAFAVIIISLIALITAGCGGSGSSSNTPPPSITISLTPASAQALDAGQTLAITASVANDSSNKGATWAVSGGGTLSNQSATAATFNAPSSVNAATTATVTATSVASAAATASLSITINPVPTITTTSLPAGTVGAAYSATVQSAGGTAPITWSISAGTLPAWASFNTASGALTGTPTAAGTTNISVIATDKAGVKTTATALSLTVAPAPLSVTTTSLPAGTTGVVYSASLQASGGTGPYTFSLASGTLPSWASLSAAGAITGIPNATGSTSFTVQATDSAAIPAKATQALTLTVNPPAALAVASTTLPAATVAVAYSTTLQATGGIAPYTWTLASGSLPAWASLVATGVISGTPSGSGSASFTVQVKDSQGTPATATQALTLTTNASGANDSLLKGQYAFVAADSAHVAVLAGSLTADGAGHITGGEFDFQGNVNAQMADAIASGSYTVGNDNRGSLTFSDGSGHSFGFSVALGSVSSGVASFGGITENDLGFTLLSGKLELQSPGAFALSALSGGYAFELGGNLSATVGNFSEVGSFALASGAISNGLLDSNQAGTVTTNAAFTGSVGTVDSHGRATVTIIAGSGTSTLATYVVTAARANLVQTGSVSGPAIYGEALQQTGAPFSAASLKGNVIIASQSATGVPSPHALLGMITADGVSSLSGVIDVNDGGAISSDQPQSGLTYTITSAANGRLTITGGVNTQAGYLVGPNSGFVIEIASGSSPSILRVLPQTAGSFTAASLKGAFAISTQPMLAAPVNAPAGIAPVTFETGVLNFDGVSVLSGTVDAAQPAVVTPGGTVSDTYAVASNGRITFTTSPVVGYIVSPTRILLLQVQPNNPNPTIQDIRQ